MGGYAGAKPYFALIKNNVVVTLFSADKKDSLIQKGIEKACGRDIPYESEIVSEAPKSNSIKSVNELKPFGLELRKNIPSSLITKKIQKNTYSIQNPPKKVSYFTNYYGIIENKKILKAFANTILYVNDDYCTQSQSVFSELKSLLSKKYGEPEGDFDILKNNALWNESRDYKMSLIKKDRVHAAFWKVSFKSNLYGIKLEEEAFSKGCLVSLSYEDIKMMEKKGKENTTKDTEGL